MKTLLLKITGTQSWGDNSKEVYRHTRNEPTFSGVMGLLGSALGIRVENAEFEPFSKLRMAVMVIKEAKKENDYHIARGFVTMKGKPRNPKKNAEQTYRYYLVNGDFIVALTGEDDVVETVATAIKSPKYHLYFGRLCCVPTNPIFVETNNCNNPLTALKEMDAKVKKEHKAVRFVFETFNSDPMSEIVHDSTGHNIRRIKSISSFPVR